MKLAVVVLDQLQSLLVPSNATHTHTPRPNQASTDYMWFSAKYAKSLLYLLISLQVPDVGCEAVRAGLAAVFRWGACAKAPDVALIREDYIIYWNSDTLLGAKPPSDHCVDPKGDNEHRQLLEVISVVLYRAHRLFSRQFKLL
ncbi:hypothetical protein EV424DRAFT_1411657 [Suillus variegatus]|nr:hypothetical protein EV424DRAFT_1411657 [Suillus variegatus]